MEAKINLLFILSQKAEMPNFETIIIGQWHSSFLWDNHSTWLPELKDRMLTKWHWPNSCQLYKEQQLIPWNQCNYIQIIIVLCMGYVINYCCFRFHSLWKCNERTLWSKNTYFIAFTYLIVIRNGWWLI